MPRSVREPDRFIHLAVDLANTVRDGRDQLVSPFDLHQFLVESGEPEPFEVTQYDVFDIVELRTRLRAVFDARTEDEAAVVLNELLAESATAPYLSPHAEVGWHLHVAKPDASWAEWLAALTATGLAELISAGGFDRIRVCAAADCGRAFIDESRNHTQRYCTSTCATRVRVTAHRARRTGPS
jgi:predicted RNA-binding Zn ribbon-like protein